VSGGAAFEADLLLWLDLEWWTGMGAANDPAGDWQWHTRAQRPTMVDRDRLITSSPQASVHLQGSKETLAGDDLICYSKVGLARRAGLEA
jgi:hypothetical protein